MVDLMKMGAVALLADCRWLRFDTLFRFYLPFIYISNRHYSILFYCLVVFWPVWLKQHTPANSRYSRLPLIHVPFCCCFSAIKRQSSVLFLGAKYYCNCGFFWPDSIVGHWKKPCCSFAFLLHRQPANLAKTRRKVATAVLYFLVEIVTS